MSNLLDVRAADGCYVSMRELCRFYEAILRSATENAPGGEETLTRMIVPAGEAAAHTLLGRSASFGLGFMTQLADHFFGDRFSKLSYGHSGLSGMTFAGADPDLGLAFAVHANGATGWSPASGPATRPELRRRAVGDAILSAAVADGATA